MRPDTHLPTKNSARAAFTRASLAAICALFCANLSSAQTGTAANSGNTETRKGPPAEALAACNSLASGQACTFEAQRGTVKGVCAAPEGKPLACRPSDAPRRGAQKSQTKQ